MPRRRQQRAYAYGRARDDYVAATRKDMMMLFYALRYMICRERIDDDEVMKRADVTLYVEERCLLRVTFCLFAAPMLIRYYAAALMLLLC